MSDASTGFELSVTRLIAAPPALVWQVMTERMEEWWCPLPWRSKIIAQEWRPGGRTCIEMTGPNGESNQHEGVVLEFVSGERFVFTDAFAPGWIPKAPFMVGIFAIAPEGTGTRYTASARHWDEATCTQHAEMGFEAGWGEVAAQLAALCEAG